MLPSRARSVLCARKVTGSVEFHFIHYVRMGLCAYCAGMQGAGAALLPGQRYKAGSPVLYCESMGIGSKAVERGTMGQVSTDPEGHFT